MMKFFSYINPWGLSARINRTKYFIVSNLITITMLCAGFFVFFPIFKDIAQHNHTLDQAIDNVISPLFVISSLMMTAYTIIACVAIITLKVKRLHDFNFSGWWVLGLLAYNLVIHKFTMSIAHTSAFKISIAVIVHEIAALVLWLMPGTKGENRFGVQPNAPSKPELGIITLENIIKSDNLPLKKNN